MSNWRLHKVLSYCVMGFIAAALLGILNIGLEEKIFGVVQLKVLLLGGLAYLAWAFTKLLHF